MGTQNLPLFLFCLFLFSLLSEYQGVEGSSIVHHHQHHHWHHHRHHRRDLVKKYQAPKLFVFGDSYADTGNKNRSTSPSWKDPYGTTFPGKPAGRYSDGRSMTDYVAKFLGTKTPIAYKLRKYAPQRAVYGINFAFGGTGVFNTLVSDPNMTVQIDILQTLFQDGVYDTADLISSVALLSVAGNDYSTYFVNGGSAQGLPAFITKLVTQVAVNIKRIHDMGVRKVAVTALQPLGCLPSSTAQSSYQRCNETNNAAVRFHNLLLQQAVANLNNHTVGSPFTIIDLYAAFTTVLNTTTSFPENIKFTNPILEPCCMGINSSYYCGSVDERGGKLYTVCEDPRSTFFWDTVHPTQAGWRAVFSTSTLHHNLQQLVY